MRRCHCSKHLRIKHPLSDCWTVVLSGLYKGWQRQTSADETSNTATSTQTYCVSSRRQVRDIRQCPQAVLRRYSEPHELSGGRNPKEEGLSISVLHADHVGEQPHDIANSTQRRSVAWLYSAACPGLFVIAICCGGWRGVRRDNAL